MRVRDSLTAAPHKLQSQDYGVTTRDSSQTRETAGQAFPECLCGCARPPGQSCSPALGSEAPSFCGSGSGAWPCPSL